jgi:hypothetical protein
VRLSQSYCLVGDFLSPSRKEREAGKWHLFPTKTGKILVELQGLCPLFLSGTVVLRSKLRPAGTGKNSLRSSGLHHGKENQENR